MTTERAILAGGCFWGVQDLFRRYAGVLSTRVGYSGGDVPNATYRNHGTHAEAIEIVFDPEKIAPMLPTLDHDLPAGARRLKQKATGLKTTIVNGQVLLKNNEHTGALPGQLLRGPLAARA